MSTSSDLDSVSADIMTAHDAVHPSAYAPSSHSKLHQLPSASKPNLIVRSGSLTQIPSIMGQESPPAECTQPRFPSVSSVQLEVVTAVAIVAIQIQFLAFCLNKIGQAILAIGIILELLGILFSICVVQMHNIDDGRHFQPLSTLVYLALRVPTLLILTGIVGLGSALVVETLKISLGTAIVMGSFLAFGVVSCLLTAVRGLRYVNDRGDNSGDIEF